jgi:hypothetical protein
MSSKDGSKQAAVTQSFVDESSTNLSAFREAYKTMSFQQLARDLKEEVTTVANNFSFKRFATDFNSSSKVLRSKLSGESGNTKELSLPVPAQAGSVDEGVAIEVEYVTDDGESTVQTEDEDDMLDQEFDALMSKGSQELSFSANRDTLHEC